MFSNVLLTEILGTHHTCLVTVWFFCMLLKLALFCKLCCGFFLLSEILKSSALLFVNIANKDVIVRRGSIELVLPVYPPGALSLILLRKKLTFVLI